jgi:hypothetical protein
LRAPNLVCRAMELEALNLPGAEAVIIGGKVLRFRFRLAPGLFGQLYTCVLSVTPDGRRPEVVVVAPHLQSLAGDRRIPHIYPHKGRGTKLCLWWPPAREWLPQMALGDTFVPWTMEWLHFFEQWLATGQWHGSGEHPRRKRWGRRATAMDAAA